MRITYEIVKPKSNMKYKVKVVEKYIVQRIKKNQNFISIFNGGTGSGKSYASIRLGMDIAKLNGTPFTIKDNVSFTFKGLIDLMRQNEDVPGYVYILEEVGAMGSGGTSMEWQSKAYKLFSTFLQTSRCKNQVLIFNCPYFYDLGASARKLAHFRFIASGIDYVNKISYFKPLMIQVNDHNKSNHTKLYFKYLQYTVNNMRAKYKQMPFDIPPDDVLKEYETMKDTYVNNTIDAIAEETSNAKKPDRIKDIIASMIKQRLANDTIKNYTGASYTYINNIRREFDHSQQLAQARI